MTVLYYLFITVFQFSILFGIIIFIKYAFNKTLKNHPFYDKFFFFFNVFVSILWSVFVIIKLVILSNNNYIIVGSICLLLIVLVWDFIKNFIFGLIIRIQYGYLVNQKINHKKTTITILNYYATYVEVRSENGNRLSYKYSSLFSNSFSVLKSDLFYVNRSISLASQNYQELLNKYKLSIVNHPLYVDNNNSFFNLKIDDDKNYFLNLHFNVLSRKHVLIMNDFIDKFNC